MCRNKERKIMKKMIAIASPPNGFALDPANNEGLPSDEKLQPMPVLYPLRLAVSLDEITKAKSGRVLSVKGGLQLKFEHPKAAT
jgi:hypothetical protein